MSQTTSAAQPAFIPIFEVAYKNNMWWSLSEWTSRCLYEQYINEQNAGYIWDWENARWGSWINDGEWTTINRYIIDFQTWEQRNIDNQRRRSIRLIWVANDRLDPQWTGEIPR